MKFQDLEPRQSFKRYILGEESGYNYQKLDYLVYNSQDKPVNAFNQSRPKRVYIEGNEEVYII